MNAEHPILVFGTTGQVGKALADLLGSRAVYVGRDVADFTNTAACVAQIDAVQPSAVINAVAYTQVDKAESEEALAIQINATTPIALATTCAARDIPFVHYSTDYVFNGTGTKPFKENDATAPLNAYGRSKLLAEQGIGAAGGKYFIFRTSWVFDADGKNFFNTMLRLASEKTALSIVGDQYGAPSYAPDLVDATMQALIEASHETEFPSGIYHMCNAGETSWYGFACEIFEQAEAAGAGLTIEEAKAIPSSDYPTPAKRPLNSRMDCSKLRSTFEVVLPEWQDAVARAVALKYSIKQQAA
jgi:dTDP-4-dehydrorhamnose reductase